MSTVSQLNTDSQSAWVQNSHLPHILESIPTGVVALDDQGRIVTFNRTAEQITGFKAFLNRIILKMQRLVSKISSKLKKPLKLKQSLLTSAGTICI
jgi:PAS domain-containing protein